MRLKRVSPSSRTNYITAETSNAAVCAVQGIITAAPIVGQQNHAIHVVHHCLGIADAR